jgi:hypothetical protein
MEGRGAAEIFGWHLFAPAPIRVGAGGSGGDGPPVTLGGESLPSWGRAELWRRARRGRRAKLRAAGVALWPQLPG